MSDDAHKRLVEKYMEGLTSLEEESQLINSSTAIGDETGDWLKYVKHKQTEAPEDLNDMLWDKFSIATKRSNKNKIIGGLILALIASITLTVINQTISLSPKSEVDKEIQLKEAMAFLQVDNKLTQERKIIYQDEIVTLFINYD